MTFFGVSLIGQQAFINGNLDEESINALALYDDQVSDFQANFSVIQNDSAGIVDYEPDANLIDEFIKEYSETKDKITQLKDAIKLTYKIPDLMIMSIPFVDETDLSVYRNILWFILGVTLFVAVFKRSS